MKVLMLCDLFVPGLGYQENLLAKYYVKAGIEVVVIANGYRNVFDFVGDRPLSLNEIQEERVDGIKIVRVPYLFNLVNRFRPLRSIRGILEAEAPSLVFVHDIIPNIVEARHYVDRHPGTRLVMDFHADVSNSGKNWLSRAVLHGVLRRAVLSYAMPSISRIYPVVPASVRFLQEHYGVPSHAMELLPLGTDVELVEAARVSGARAALRTRYSIPSSAKVIFTGGKLTASKGTLELIEAVVALQRSDVFLFVVGNSGDDPDGYYQRLVRAASAAKTVILVGWQDERGVFDYLAASDMAVFPTSQSILWQHAIGSGLPLILADERFLPGRAQDISYLNRHENILIASGPEPLVRRLTDAIGTLADDDDLRHKMSRGASMVCDECLDWSKWIQRTRPFLLGA